jgi:hypothetical protein
MLLDAAGLDFGGALGLMADDEQNMVEIRCLVADFKVRHGTMTTQTLILDTGDTKLVGHGYVDLGSEWFVDITLLPSSKDFSLLAAQAPLHVHGSVKDLAIDVSTARVLFSLLTPIELGTTDNATGQQLIQRKRPQYTPL